MSEQRIAEYRDQVVQVAVRQAMPIRCPECGCIAQVLTNPEDSSWPTFAACPKCTRIYSVQQYAYRVNHISGCCGSCGGCYGAHAAGCVFGG